MMIRFYLMALVAMLVVPIVALAQNSSLYLQPAKPPPPAEPTNRQPTKGISTAIAEASLIASPKPEPRRFKVHDLVTIIVRESTSARIRSSMETEKQINIDGKISQFPRLVATDLLNGQISRGNRSGNQPELKIEFNKKFEGEGDYRRQDTLTTRLTAQIIDIKPNGTLVLEARKRIQTEDETLKIVLTGTCRREDVRADNTVLSTELYDLNLIKTHEGLIRKATSKGLFTRIIEGLFAF